MSYCQGCADYERELAELRARLAAAESACRAVMAAHEAAGVDELGVLRPEHVELIRSILEAK